MIPLLCNNRRHRTQGFSLIEIMVYLSVLVLVAGALVTTFLSLDTVLVRNKTDRALTESARVSLERLVRDTRAAQAVNTGLSVFDDPSGALALTQGATTTRFYVTGESLMLSVNGVELGPLTSSAVVVQSFVVTRYVASTTEMVRTALTLSASSKAASSTRTYYSSAVLRGTYE